MIKTILVPATGGSGDAAAFSMALAAARNLGAHLDFLHVRIDPAEVAAAFATDIGGVVSAQMIDQVEAEAAQREERAQKAVHEFCRRAGIPLNPPDESNHAVSAQWHREAGNEASWVAEYGRTSDLVVIGRANKSEGASREIREAALLDTGRPLLIPGRVERPLETVAIAWKSQREAARAVTSASPFIAKAKRVVVLTVSEGRRSDESEARLLATLRRHNGTIEVRRLNPADGSVADALLRAVTEHGAGLLVMGGYSHSRLRELVFGGVTERMLRGADVAVLMAH